MISYHIIILYINVLSSFTLSAGLSALQTHLVYSLRSSASATPNTDFIPKSRSGCNVVISQHRCQRAHFMWPDPTRPDPPNFQPDPIQPADHKQNTDPTGPTCDQKGTLLVCDDSKSWIFEIQFQHILHVVKFVFKIVKSCKHEMHGSSLCTMNNKIKHVLF